MTRQFTAPAAFTDKPYEPIHMVPVESNQVKAIGYDAATNTLACSFTRGPGHIYHYPNVSPELHADYAAARLEIESLQSQLHAAKQINAAQFHLLAASMPGHADGESNV